MKKLLYFLIGFLIPFLIFASYAKASTAYVVYPNDECSLSTGSVRWGASHSFWDGTASSPIDLVPSGWTYYGFFNEGFEAGSGTAYYSNPDDSSQMAAFTKIRPENLNCFSDNLDSDGDGINDDCDIYPNDPTDYQVGLFSYQTNSAGELVRQCFVTDRQDIVCFGADYNSSNQDHLKVSTNWENADSLCDSDPGGNFGEPDDYESSGDFDDDDIVNGKDPDIDDDGIPNDYDDNDYQYDENDSDPIDPSDPFDDSDGLPVPTGFEDDLIYYPNILSGDSNVDSDHDGATSQDIRDLSSDQHLRVLYLNSGQSDRHNDLKKHIGDAAEYLNSEEYERDKIAETNADSRHNDLKTQVDNKFSGLDKNQVSRNTKTNSAISNVKTSVDAVGTGIGTVAGNINATNQNLESIAGVLGISKGHLSDISDEIGKISNPSITLTTPTADAIGEAVSSQLINSGQTIDKTITDNIPALDKTDTLTAIKTKYSDRSDLFITTLKGSDLFSLPFGIFTGPSGSGSSIQTVNIGKWGASGEQTATIDYADYDNVWQILRSVLLLVTSFSCFKIIVLKKA